MNNEDYIPGTKIEKPEVELAGNDGNAMVIIGSVRRALKRAGVDASIVEAFSKEATSGDYDNVLQTAMKYADVY